MCGLIMERVQMMLCLLCLVSTQIKLIVSVPDVLNVSVVARTETELTLQWYNDNNYSYILKGIYGDERIYSESLGDVVTHTVSYLSPGTKYTFTVFTVFEGTQSSGYSFTTATTPSNVTGLHCEYSWMGNVITLKWDVPFGLRSGFEVQVDRGIPEQVNVTRYQINDVSSADQYDIIVTSLSGDVRSSPVSVKCQTNTSGAVALLYVLVVLLIIVLIICLGVFLKHKRCFLGGRGDEQNAADQPMDQIYINTSTHNTAENPNSSIELEIKDTSEEINHYEAPDMSR